MNSLINSPEISVWETEMCVSIYNFSKQSLKAEFERVGLHKLDYKRIWPWLYRKLSSDFAEMSDLPQRSREMLQQNFCFVNSECVEHRISQDGTEKVLLKLSDHHCIETVMIPDRERSTICVSSQIGCACGCRFCYTGTQKCVRNLYVSEIIEQILFWHRRLHDNERQISNIVFMGMGEPMHNYRNLSEALRIMLDHEGMNISRHRITVSTSGVMDNILAMGEAFGVRLAISLHATNNDQREKIMPINRICHIEEIVRIAQLYPKTSNTKYVTYEYLLLSDINDTMDDAKALYELTRSHASKINLIEFNTWNGCEYVRSKKAEDFYEYLLRCGARCSIRRSRGDDIMAACGQLNGEMFYKEDICF